MSIYTPLGEYLRKQDQAEVTLSFDDIEKILNFPLPRTAVTHRPYWSNSHANDGHPGRVWLAAGWRQIRFNIAARSITLRRQDVVAATLESLKPSKKGLLYDLLQDAGLSVDEWHRTADGNPVLNFRANPRYCYEWSFGSVADGFVLCLWLGNLSQEADGKIILNGNNRALEEKLLTVARDESAETSRRLRANDQAIRSKALDNAVHESYRRGLALRAVIVDGNQRDEVEIGERSSSVSLRHLDTAEWYVHAYNNVTGAYLLVRGVEPEVSGDEPETGSEDDLDATYDEVQQRAIKTRRGQARFRQQLLGAYRRACAVTGSFVESLLEAAHIVPHSLVTDYSIRNGLLLRADIHTLFDEHLLSVDGYCKIHVSRTLRHSEYWTHNGKQLNRIPERSEDRPSAEGLDAHYSRFLKHEKAR